jgi:hypothetical protein
MTQQAARDPALAPSVRTAAAVLIAAPLLMVLGMAHHPSIQAHEPAEVVAQARAIGATAAAVHAVLIALMIATLLALVEFSLWRGLARPKVRVALLGYALGVICMTVAALVSGFVTTNAARLNPGMTPADLQQSVTLMSFAALFNQAFARCGAILMSGAIAAWSLELLHGAALQRWVALFGIVTGLGCVLVLLAGGLRLDVHGMQVVNLLQACWVVGAGTLLLRSRMDSPASGVVRSV